MEKIGWTDRVRIEVRVLHRVKKERSILRTTERKKANRIGYILRRNCLLKHVIKGKIEGKGRGGIRCKQLLVYLTKTRR
jgi:hypothetical protein